MVLVALGLGALVAESAAVFTVVRLAGAAYLVLIEFEGMDASGLRASIDSCTTGTSASGNMCTSTDHVP